MKTTCATVACVLMMSVAGAQAWQGKFSSSDHSSTTRTVDPLEAVKAELRGKIVDGLNTWREDRWGQLKDVLDAEAFFREFSGTMFGLGLDLETDQSQLWRINDFSTVSSIGGGLGCFVGANSLTFDRRRRELLTVAKTCDTGDFVVAEINPATGVARTKCTLDLSNSSFQIDSMTEILDLAHTNTGIVMWVRDAGLAEQNHTLLFVEDDQGFGTDDGDMVCAVTNLADSVDLSNPPFGDGSSPYGLYDDSLDHRVGEPLENTALVITTQEFDMASILTVAERGEIANLDATISGVLDVLNVQANDVMNLRCRSGDYDPQHAAVWYIGTTNRWNFLCGFLLADINAAGFGGTVKPSGCFEIPALDGFAIMP